VVQFNGEFLQRNAHSGFPKQDWETGKEFAARLIRAKPDQADLARNITERYYQLRFSKATR